MKTYQCHKKVKAFKIRRISILASTRMLYGDDGEQVEVMDSWGPQGKSTSQLLGGYYVLYDDSYSSWSPAEAFEAGYSVIES